jgi:hypothetical protein
VIGIGVSVSLDELAIGFAIGLVSLRGPPFSGAVLIGAQALLVSQVGLRLGSRLRRGAGRVGRLCRLESCWWGVQPRADGAQGQRPASVKGHNGFRVRNGGFRSTDSYRMGIPPSGTRPFWIGWLANLWVTRRLHEAPGGLGKRGGSQRSRCQLLLKARRFRVRIRTAGRR